MVQKLILASVESLPLQTNCVVGEYIDFYE